MIDPADIDDDQVAEAVAPASPLDDLVQFLYRRAEWIDRAACRDVPTGVFYAEVGETIAGALAVCSDCPVRHDCLDHAIDTNEKHGVWGGASERERQRIKHQRRRSA